jgi:CRP/FNR family transcriptional regulator
MLDLATPRTVTNNPPLVDFFLNPLLGARRASVPQGTQLYSPTQPASNVYFVHRGQVKVFQSGRNNEWHLLEILGPNEWFGAAALSGASSHSSRAVAVVPSVVSEIPIERVFALLLQQPRTAVELLKSVATRLRQAREEAGRLIFDDCHTRLVRALIRFSRSACASPHNSGVAVHLTHQELGQAIGVARETVSLTLKELRDRGLLRTGRNHVIFDPAALERGLAGETENAARPITV